jgi:hypothetical protein
MISSIKLSLDFLTLYYFLILLDPLLGMTITLKLKTQKYYYNIKENVFPLDKDKAGSIP